MRRVRSALCATVVLVSIVAVGTGVAGAAELVTTDRIAGSDRHATAAAIAREAFSEGATSAVLARSDQFPDALAGSFLAGSVSGPVLLTAGDRLSTAAASALDARGVETVHVLGGTGAISSAVTSELVAEGYTVRRVAGASRYETAARIARAGTVGQLDGTPTALLAGGADFPDALAAGPVAFAAGLPILLTPADALAPEAAAAIEDLGIGHVVVLGGTAAVSDAVLDGISAAGATSERIAGSNRFETAAAIADFAVERLGWAGAAVGLARGDAFPDGLAGGPHGGLAEAPMLLTEPDALSAETSQWLSEHVDTIATVTAFGGTGAVSDDALEEARVAAGDPSGTGGFSVVGAAATATPGSERECRVITDPDDTIQLRLLPSSLVVGSDGEAPTFTDADADGLADPGAPRAGIRAVDGRTLSPPVARIDDQDSDGDLAIAVGSDEYDDVVLVAFVDADDGTAHELDVDADGRPTDETVVGCQSSFAPLEAPTGTHTGVTVGTVNADDGSFFDDAGQRRFQFAADDTYRNGGVASGVAEFTALVSRGDVLNIAYVQGAGASTFEVVSDVVVAASTADAAAVDRDVTVTFTVPDSNGDGTRYRVFRVPTHLIDDACSSYEAQTGTTVATIEAGPYVDLALADGCYKYRIITVASSGETLVSGFSLPVMVPAPGAANDTTRPTSISASIAEGTVDARVGAGDTITIVFSEPMATPSAGASITVASSQTSATFTAGSGATFTLNTTARTVNGVERAPGTVLTVTISSNPASPVALPATISNHAGITDRAANSWDLVASPDRTLESS